MLGPALRDLDALIAELPVSVADPATGTASRLRATCQDLAAFGVAAADRVQAMTTRSALRELGRSFRAWQEKITPLAVELDELRGRFADDEAAERARLTELQAQVADRQRWVDQRADAEDAGVLGTVLGALVPFAGELVAREIDSELTYGRGSADVIAESEARLAQIAVADAEIARIGAVLGLLTQALGSVQNLDNALSLLVADLAEDGRVSARATEDTFPLFRASLSTRIHTLIESLDLT